MHYFTIHTFCKGNKAFSCVESTIFRGDGSKIRNKSQKPRTNETKAATAADSSHRVGARKLL